VWLKMSGIGAVLGGLALKGFQTAQAMPPGA
jgi:hypothetical protein